MTPKPLVTVVVPSYNQGRYLEEALVSIFRQPIPVEVFVIDGGSSDNSLEIIHKWEKNLAGWRSHRDKGQAAAINEGIARGTAPYVCWLNSDDFFLSNGLSSLVSWLEEHPAHPAAYGQAWNYREDTQKKTPVFVEPFNHERLALRCIISQPASLVRRSVWKAVGGVDEGLHLAMDYDLWWRVYKKFGSLGYVNKYIAVNRDHKDTKTRTRRVEHYKEAIKIVRKHNGDVPIKWWLAQPYAVWFKSLIR